MKIYKNTKTGEVAEITPFLLSHLPMNEWVEMEAPKGEVKPELKSKPKPEPKIAEATKGEGVADINHVEL